MRKVADVMHVLFATHGSSLLPLFDQLLPTFSDMLVSIVKHVVMITSLIIKLSSFFTYRERVDLPHINNGLCVFLMIF